jgi:hypothetical protein
VSRDNPGLTFDPGYVYGPIKEFEAFWVALYVEVSFLKHISHLSFFLNFNVVQIEYLFIVLLHYTEENRSFI